MAAEKGTGAAAAKEPAGEKRESPAPEKTAKKSEPKPTAEKKGKQRKG